MDLQSIITKHNDFINTSPNLSEHSKNFMLYETIINLFNEYIRFHDDYPFENYSLEYRFHIAPIGDYTKIIKDECIKNFLIDNSIKNEGCIIDLRRQIELYSYSLPTVNVSKSRELKNNIKKIIKRKVY